MPAENVKDIEIAYPEATDLNLRISVGACRLKIQPGEGDAWVTGTYNDPSGALPSRITEQGGNVRITHEPNWPSIFGLFSGAPSFDLKLGKARPYSLTFESGASETILDLGGLPLKRLQFKQGAGKAEIAFSSPNPQEMTLMSINTGASSLETMNLVNANSAETTVEGGAAAYRLDFGGELTRDQHVNVSTGVSAVEVSVKEEHAVKIVAESAMGGLDIGNGFTKQENAFFNQAALANKTPILVIQASVTLGSLRLRLT